MAAVSVVRKLQRCERLHGRQDDLPHVVKYKIKIKDGLSSSNSISINSNCASVSAAATKALAELTDALVHVASTAPLLHDASPQSFLCFDSPEDALVQHPFPPWQLAVSGAQDSRGFRVPVAASAKLKPAAAAESAAPRRQLTWKADDSGGEEEEEEGMWERPPWKLQLERPTIEEVQQKEKAGGDNGEREEEEEALAAWQAAMKEKKKQEEWGVEEIECECCGMEEECTKAYEERVRGALGGHWLCGLCEEAVREEQKRLGGKAAASLQTALQAHMQPCRSFSSRARAGAQPPPSDLAVPHAVCRLLRRHLSTPSPSPRQPPSTSTAALPRSASCLPTFGHSAQP